MTTAPEGIDQADWDRASVHAGLGVGHVWWMTSCPAYRTLKPADCTCALQDFYGRRKDPR